MEVKTIDVDVVRAQFPALQQPSVGGEPAVFFDGPGGTQVPRSVIDAMSNYLSGTNANIEGEFETSAKTDEVIAKARNYGAAFVGGSSDGISFGPNMTTLNFNLIRALGRTLKPGDEIITTVLDHDANVAPWLLMAEDRGLVVRQVAVTDELQLDLADLESKLSDRTKVVAFCLASNAVGTLTPAPEVARLAHEAGALVWADAVAYAPHRRIDVEALECDVLLCSPYKYFGPHLGMSWMRTELAETLPAERVRPAGSKPPGHRFETGTQLHENIAGFVAAVDYLASLGDGDDLRGRLDSAYGAIESRETELANQLISALRELPRLRLTGVQGANPSQRVGTFGLVVEGERPAVLSRALGEKGIYTWNGNFYAQSIVEHLGLDLEEGLLRIGLMHYNTEREIQRCVEQLGLLLSKA
ncbi:MAG TPA: cysteine desulfurase-like protein [Acidimicrobiales bacterium]|nr:cysteine desulfurase-like protein [Acidimicrobiales bacterium]